jgi:hypothetical protein
MTVKFAPWGNQQFFDENGDPAVGWKIYAYVAGSSTAQNTYTDSTGGTPQSNPIILNALGLPTTGQIWFTAGQMYKLVLTDENDVVQKTEDNLSGINDTSVSISQWASSGFTPTYVSTTSFTVVGDQTTDLHVGRRLQFTVTAGTVYGEILTSAYTTLTTVTVLMDGTQTLDSGLSAVNVSILRADQRAIPRTLTNNKHGADIASASTINLNNASGDLVDVTGTTTITAITLADGSERTVRFTGALTLTHGASLVLPTSANITTAAGDFAVFRGYASGVVRCVSYHPLTGKALAGTSESYVYIRDEKAANTAGGNFSSGAWRTRDLNTEVNDPGSVATLASNQITLTAGTYRFRASAPAYQVDRHKVRLANVSDTVYYYGTSDTSNSADATMTRSAVSGRFTIATSKTFELQHQCQTTCLTSGFGVASNLGVIEVYAEIEFWKEM